jgi:hypothetical protein
MSLVAVACLTASLLFGLLLPIYTDEVVWRFQLSRAVFDGGVDRFIGQACGPNTLARAPLFMQPLRFASAWLNAIFADPVFVRLFGVAMALVWVALLWRLIDRVARSPRNRNEMLVLGLGLLGLGVLPLQLVWSRPEQPLLITLTLALLLALRGGDAREDSSLRQSWLAAAAVVILGAIALSYHLKAVAFLPVFLVCAAYASHGRPGRLSRIVAIATLVVLGAVAAQYWVHRFQCPGDSLLNAKLERENVAELLFAGDFSWEILGRIFTNMLPSNYVRLSIPGQSYMSFWLPPVDVPSTVALYWKRFMLLVWYASIISGGIAMLVALRDAIRSRRLDVRLAIAITLAATATVWGASQLHRNAYEATFYLPVAMLFAIFSIQAAAPGGSRIVGWLSSLVLVVSIVSQGLLVTAYTGRLWSISTHPGYIAAQPFSFSAYGYRTLEPQIRAAAKMCGIDQQHPIHELLIDDLTYFPYMTSWRPLHRLGVLQVWNGSITDPIAYLRDKGSSGIVMGCLYLPPQLLARAHQVGQFCCLDSSG